MEIGGVFMSQFCDMGQFSLLFSYLFYDFSGLSFSFLFFSYEDDFVDVR